MGHDRVPVPVRVCLRAHGRRRWPWPRRRGDDRGQAVPLLAAAVALAALTMLALGPVGRALVDRTRARTAADAAALAGAAEGEGTARRLAAANGADLVGYDTLDGAVLVEVRVGGATAHARARAVGPAPGAGSVGAGSFGTGPVPVGGGDRAGLAPAMLAALARADRLLGRPVPVASGLRTAAEQRALWAHRATNPYPVARPGTSDHERGMAVDVPRGFVDVLVPVAAAAGLCRPVPVTDPVHFTVCGA